MGYTVDYSTMQAILGTYREMTGKWNGELSSVMEKTQAIVTSTNIAGNKANNMKQYLAMTYSYIYNVMVELLALFFRNYLLYTEDYARQIDPERDTHINSEELGRLHDSLQTKRGSFQHIGMNAERTLSKVADIVSTPSLDISGLDIKVDGVLKSLDDLDNAVNTLESAHISADFEEIDAMISGLKAFIKELYNQEKVFKIGFSKKSFMELASVPGLLLAMKNADERLSAQESDVALAMANLEKRHEQEQKELKKRQKRIKWAKAGVAVLTTVTSAVCVATGAGTLLVPVICTVGKSAFDAAADEYETHGWDTDQWNKANIGKEAVKGWFSGFTGAILPPGAGDFAKAGLSSANSALWGGLDNAYDQMAATGRITDTKSIWFDAEKSGVSSFVGELAGNTISDKVEKMPIGLGLDKYTNPTKDVRHYVGKFIVGSTDEVSSGIVDRGVSTTVEIAYDIGRNDIHGVSAWEDIDLGDRYKDVMSFEKIALDFVKGGSKEVVSSYITERKPDPKTGLTPIIQAKLGYETNPETGLTGAVQDSLSHIVDEDQFSDILREMEERNPSARNAATVAATDDQLTTGDNGLADNTDDYYKYGDSPSLNSKSHNMDWENTASTPEEIQLIEEMESNGELDVMPSELGQSFYDSDTAKLTEKPIEITFTYNDKKYGVDEFISQGDMQEEGLNGMTVAEYLDNYDRYQAEGRELNDEQKNYRMGIVETVAYENGEQQIADIMQNNPNLSYDEASRMIDYEGRVTEAQREVSSQAALHDPDQITGGDPNNIHAMGSGRVNSSFGSQWRWGRAENLHEEVLKASQGMTREEMENTRLNIKFNYKSKNSKGE